MRKCFNVIDTPWLPVRKHCGETALVGLKEALTGAHRYQGLADPSPPNLIALHRLLLTMLHRALVREGVAWEPRKWWAEGLPEKPIMEYLEKWRERLYAFHPEHPFMQVAALHTAEETKNKLKPWTQLALDRASGNTPLVFDHSFDEVPALVDTGTVLRNLLGFLQSTPGGLIQSLGKVSDNAGPLSNMVATLPLGNTLCRTLLLGLHRTAKANDLPAWELPVPTINDLRSEPTLSSGLNDRYTRLTRAVLFVSEDEDGQYVRHIRYAAGLAIEDNAAVPEPMAAFFEGKKGPMRLSLRAGRALWRDLPALLPSLTEGHGQHPRILDTAAQVLTAIDDECVHIPVLVAGYAVKEGKPAKLERWRIATISLPKSVLNAGGPAAGLRDLVTEAETTGAVLGKTAWELCMKAFGRARSSNMTDGQSTPPTSTKERQRITDMSGALPMQPVFYAHMEQAVPELIRLLGEGKPSEAEAHWRIAQASAANQAWQATCAALGVSIPAIKAAAQVKWKHDALVNRLRKAAKGETAKEETA